MCDGRILHPEAVAAKNTLKKLCSAIVLRMRKDGFVGMPKNEEWADVHRLVEEALVRHSLPVGSPVVWADFRRVESHYPDVKLESFLRRVVTTLEEGAAPIDKLRAGYWECLRKASSAELAGRDNDAGLVQWILESAQWQDEERWESLTPGQWGEVERIVRPLTKNAPPPPSPSEIKARNYQEIQQGKEFRGRACLRELIQAAGSCRQAVGAEFSRQLHRLWCLDAPWVQEKLRAFTHVKGGRCSPGKREREGKYMEEGRPPTAGDKKAARRQKKTAERVRRNRAKQA
jgi:hypothetical protein